ncbi:MAG: hypothetical protein ACK48K_00730 [Planctomycetota bacterium]
MKRLLEPLGVECIDARQVEKDHPSRILCGWELKLYATLHSPFAQVLFLDADNGVVCDPTYLFDCEEYKRHGAIFWPDYACWTLKPGVWKVFGMMDMAEPEVAEHERAFESGQYLIDKRRCDRERPASFVHSFTKLNLTNVYATYAEPKHHCESGKQQQTENGTRLQSFTFHTAANCILLCPKLAWACVYL